MEDQVIIVSIQKPRRDIVAFPVVVLHRDGIEHVEAKQFHPVERTVAVLSFGSPASPGSVQTPIV